MRSTMVERPVSGRLPETSDAPRFRLLDACWTLASNDGPARAVTTVAVLVALSSAVFPPETEWLRILGYIVAPLALGLGMLWALYKDARRIRDRVERGFWHDIQIGIWAFWLSLLLGNLTPVVGAAASAIGSRVMITLGWSALLLAIERLPHRAGYWRSRTLERRLSLLSVTTLVLGLLVYFSVLPILVHLPEVEVAIAATAVPTAQLFTILSLLFTARLVVSSATIDNMRWRILYRMLALFGASIALFNVRGLGGAALWSDFWFEGTGPLPWLLPCLVGTFAVRLRHYPFPSEWKPEEPRDDPVRETRTGLESRTLVVAICIPVLHFAFHQMGVLDPDHRPSREIWVVGWALCLGAIALFQRHLLAARLRQILLERRKIERTLAASDRRLRVSEERKKADEMLFFSREKYAKAFRASPYAMVISRISDGMHLEYNDRYLEILGYARQEVEGRTTEELEIWADSELRKDMVERIRGEGSVRDFEIDFRRRDGSIRRARVSAELLRIDGQPCLLSVSHPIRPEDSQGAMARTSAELLEGAREAAAVLDEAGRVRQWNRAAETLFGYRENEIWGSPLLTLLAGGGDSTEAESREDGAAPAGASASAEHASAKDILERARRRVVERGLWTGRVETTDRFGEPLGLEVWWCRADDRGRRQLFFALPSQRRGPSRRHSDATDQGARPT